MADFSGCGSFLLATNLSGCSNNTHGPSCTSVCGHCINGAVCSHVDGSCEGGCDAGWTGEACVTSKSHYVNVSVLIKFLQKTILFTLIITSSP